MSTGTSYIISARANDEFALGTQDRVVAEGEKAELQCHYLR